MPAVPNRRRMRVHSGPSFSIYRVKAAWRPAYFLASTACSARKASSCTISQWGIWFARFWRLRGSEVEALALGSARAP
jgi:hypothetical protein